MKKIFSKAIMGMSIAFIIWLSGSFLEVSAHNSEINPQYSKYNAFTIILDIFYI